VRLTARQRATLREMGECRFLSDGALVNGQEMLVVYSEPESEAVLDAIRCAASEPEAVAVARERLLAAVRLGLSEQEYHSGKIQDAAHRYRAALRAARGKR
jgi:hypothetical protein